jgi:hypothetical protein
VASQAAASCRTGLFSPLPTATSSHPGPAVTSTLAVHRRG